MDSKKYRPLVIWRRRVSHILSLTRESNEYIQFSGMDGLELLNFCLNVSGNREGKGRRVLSKYLTLLFGSVKLEELGL